MTLESSTPLGCDPGTCPGVRDLSKKPRSETSILRRSAVAVLKASYLLVVVGLPHHHGVGVGSLAGGDHGGLVEHGGDSGESGHGD